MEKNVGICLLRLLLSFCVIMCHFTNVTGFWSYLRFLAVPGFVFLSFYLTWDFEEGMLGNKVAKRLERLIFPMFFWGGVYYVIYKLIGEQLQFKDLILQCFIGYGYNGTFWYFTVQIILILLFLLIYKLPKKARKLVLALLLVLCFIVQYTGWNAWLASKMAGETIGMANTWGRIAELFPYAVCGSFFAGKINKLQNKTRNVLPFLLCGMVYVVYLIPWPQTRGYLYQGFGPLFGTLFLCTGFIFMSVPLKKRIEKAVIFLSQHTMGVYCVHMLTGRCMQKMIAFEMNDIVFCFLNFIISMLVSIMISFIPKCKRMVC